MIRNIFLQNTYVCLHSQFSFKKKGFDYEKPSKIQILQYVLLVYSKVLFLTGIIEFDQVKPILAGKLDDFIK